MLCLSAADRQGQRRATASPRAPIERPHCVTLPQVEKCLDLMIGVVPESCGTATSRRRSPLPSRSRQVGLAADAA